MIRENKELRLISLPNIVRQSEYEVEVSPYEVMFTTMLLSNKFGNVSRVTIGMLEQVYSLSKKNVNMFRNAIEEIQNKGLVNIETYEDKITKHTLLEVRENIDEQYLTIDYNLIENILLSDNRIDTKANMIYTLVVLQSRAGYKDFKNSNSQKGYSFPSITGLATDIGVSRVAILNSIEELERMNILKVIRQGKYTTTSKEGKQVVREYANVYIIKQVNYTDSEIRLIEREATHSLAELEDQAGEKREVSQYISAKTGDNYNKFREEELNVVEYENKHLNRK